MAEPDLADEIAGILFDRLIDDECDSLEDRTAAVVRLYPKWEKKG